MSAVGALVGSVLLVVEIVLFARVVLDRVRVLAPGGGAWTIRARRVTHDPTEPVIAPVRRVLPPLRVARCRSTWRSRRSWSRSSCCAAW
jgi:YggT family protein